MSTRIERQAKELQEVRDFMSAIGLEHCTDTVLNDGLFLSLRLLKDASYNELIVACKLSGHQAAHILTNLGLSAPHMDASLDELLSSIGVVEVTSKDALAYAGFTSIRSLRPMSAIELTGLGLRAVQAQLIVSTIASVDDDGRHPSPDDASTSEQRHSMQPPADAVHVPDMESAHLPVENVAAMDVASEGAPVEGTAAEGAADEDAAMSLLGERAGARPTSQSSHRRLMLPVVIVLLLSAIVGGGLWLVHASARAPQALPSPAAASPHATGHDGHLALDGQESTPHRQRGQDKGSTRVLGQGKGSGRAVKRKPGKSKSKGAGGGGGALSKHRNATRVGALSKLESMKRSRNSINIA